MSIEVAITIDVEFTVGGAFADPDRMPVGPKSVYCPIGGKSAGLGFILDTLEAYGLKGVFFVEALNTCHFGDEPMGEIARGIRARGHDVQLHAHPCWMVFGHDDWFLRVRDEVPCDSFAKLTNEEIDRALNIGVDVFRRWGLPPPLAFRAGNLEVDARIYHRLEHRGIPLASNIGIGVFAPPDPSLFLAGGRHRIGRTLEVPVASYPDIDLPRVRRWKTFTIVGTGAWEARQWLQSAAREGVGPVIVLTHPAEFIRSKRDDYDALRWNGIARQRLRSLCAYLADNAADFEVVTFAGAVERWRSGNGTTNPRWHASPWARMLRVAENRASERLHAA